jgi:hypothetical protein
MLQLAVQAKLGRFELALQTSSFTTECGFGRMNSCLLAPGIPARPASPTPLAVLFDLPAEPAGSTVAGIEASTAGALQTAAINPAAVDAALQLQPTPLAGSVEAVLLGSSDQQAAHNFATCTSQGSGLDLGLHTAAGALGLVLVQVVKQLQALPAPLPAPSHAAAAIPGAAESAAEPEQLLYNTAWLADSPFLGAAPVRPTGVTLSASSSTSAAQALSVLQPAVQFAAGAAIAMRGVVLPMALPAPAGQPQTSGAAMMGLLKAVVQEVPSFAIATSHNTSAAGSPWTATLASSSRGIVGDVYGTAAQGGLQHVPRLLAQPAAAPSAVPQRLAGSFAVTGGSGVLGSYVALWLMHGASSVHLCSRSGGMLGFVQQQAAPGVLLAAHKVDATLQSDLTGLLGAIASAPLAGIVHSGGVLADATLAKQTQATMRQVCL